MNAFIFLLCYYFLPNDEKALARYQMIAQSYPDGNVWDSYITKNIGFPGKTNGKRQVC
jgi:hypothetical protein